MCGIALIVDGVERVVGHDGGIPEDLQEVWGSWHLIVCQEGAP